MKRMLILFLTLFFYSINYSQDFSVDEDTTEVECSHSSLDIGINSTGISFGNSECWNGIRINTTDCEVKNVNGINITLWKPEKNPASTVNGIALGIAPAAKNINGLSFGLAALLGKKNLRGINIGTIATVGGNIGGLNFGGLALVSRDNIAGINFGGFATVAKGNISGINFGGFALVSNKNISGVNVGGLALVSKGNINGINFGGLALVSNSNVSGINIGGLAIVSKEGIKGINVGGLALVSKGDIFGLNQSIIATFSKGTIKGFNFSGYKMEADEFYGLNVTPGWVEVGNLYGISIASFHKIEGTQKGLVIGILNIAEELKGVQLGLINIAKNNSGILKVLPLINFHF